MDVVFFAERKTEDGEEERENKRGNERRKTPLRRGMSDAFVDNSVLITNYVHLLCCAYTQRFPFVSSFFFPPMNRLPNSICLYTYHVYPGLYLQDAQKRGREKKNGREKMTHIIHNGGLNVIADDACIYAGRVAGRVFHVTGTGLLTLASTGRRWGSAPMLSHDDSE